MEMVDEVAFATNINKIYGPESKSHWLKGSM